MTDIFALTWLQKAVNVLILLAQITVYDCVWHYSWYVFFPECARSFCMFQVFSWYQFFWGGFVLFCTRSFWLYQVGLLVAEADCFDWSILFLADSFVFTWHSILFLTDPVFCFYQIPTVFCFYLTRSVFCCYQTQCFVFTRPSVLFLPDTVFCFYLTWSVFCFYQTQCFVCTRHNQHFVLFVQDTINVLFVPDTIRVLYQTWSVFCLYQTQPAVKRKGSWRFCAVPTTLSSLKLWPFVSILTSLSVWHL